jgi:hypothetical protein
VEHGEDREAQSQADNDPERPRMMHQRQADDDC